VELHQLDGLGRRSTASVFLVSAPGIAMTPAPWTSRRHLRSGFKPSGSMIQRRPAAWCKVVTVLTTRLIPYLSRMTFETEG
jgi:hypothetical protein